MLLITGVNGYIGTHLANRFRTEGMPVRGNKTHGWVEHAFTPIRTTRMRLLITRSEYGNRMGMGEWEAYSP